MMRIKSILPYTLFAGCLLTMLHFTWKQRQCLDPDLKGLYPDQKTMRSISKKSATNRILPSEGPQNIAQMRVGVNTSGKSMENIANSKPIIEGEIRTGDINLMDLDGRQLKNNARKTDNNTKKGHRQLKLCSKTVATTSPPYAHSPSGLWAPSECRARHSVALVVPYRDREGHRRIFLEIMPGFLRRQWLEYVIVIVEQKSPDIFNRGYILNIGLTEVQRLPHISCVVFHDVDLLPENPSIRYSCHQEPFHLGAFVNSSNYRSTPGITGGVLAISPRLMHQVNGFSNIYWGWGGEDEDLYNRLSAQGIRVLRGDPRDTRYVMLPHGKDTHNPVIRKKFASQLTDWTEDGLNSLNYSVGSIGHFHHHIQIEVVVDVDERTQQWLHEKYDQIRNGMRSV